MWLFLYNAELLLIFTDSIFLNVFYQYCVGTIFMTFKHLAGRPMELSFAWLVLVKWPNCKKYIWEGHSLYYHPCFFVCKKRRLINLRLTSWLHCQSHARATYYCPRTLCLNPPIPGCIFSQKMFLLPLRTFPFFYYLFSRSFRGNISGPKVQIRMGLFRRGKFSIFSLKSWKQTREKRRNLIAQSLVREKWVNFQISLPCFFSNPPPCGRGKVRIYCPVQ